MRYYDLKITEPNTNRIVKEWGTMTSGTHDPAAQNIMFDMPVTPLGTPTGGQTIVIEGVSLNDIYQAREFTGLNFSLKAGMSKGLPLANPLQANVIASGFIFQSFGNWIGTEMSLSFVVYPDSFYIDNPGNITLNWEKGTSLESAITSSLNVAFPNVKKKINISPNIVLPNDETGFYSSLGALSEAINKIIISIGHHVFISMQNGVINIFDETYSSPPIIINFLDLLGQPAWIEANIMQLKTVMRADINIGEMIKMPKGINNTPGIITTRGESVPSLMKYKTAFQGDFRVLGMRHLGNLRSPDGNEWATVINAAVEAKNV